MNAVSRCRIALLISTGWLVIGIAHEARADGLVVAPKAYKGSLNERAQEAIILFHAGDATRSASEDLILKIRVEGSVESFAWVLALPNVPKTAAEDAKLFEELHRYVEVRKSRMSKAAAEGSKSSSAPATKSATAVEVISRQDVGSFDVAIVRENEAGSLNGWLVENGYRGLEGADDLVDFYRKKGYVFACVRVTNAAMKAGSADLHPLRFTFDTGGKDGVYFPMRLTGLQAERFDVNLYVLYGKWLNDRLNGYGFANRGFALNWRDYDSPQCEPNLGKRWSDPGADPYLGPLSGLVPTVTKLCQKLHPGERYYLTNLQATGLNPREVRDWPDDLWLFPYYTDPRMIPLDAREGGPASAAYRNVPASIPSEATRERSRRRSPMWVVVGLAFLMLGVGILALKRSRRRPKTTSLDF